MVDPAEAGTPSAGSEFKLGEMAPVWISDDSVSMCMGCMVHFTVTRRRHHCRSCGKVLCGSCSSLTHYLNYLKKIARVCNNCYDTLEEGVGNEWVISLPKNEAEVVLRHEEQEDATDSKAKIKRRKSKLRHSKRKLPVPKLPAVLTEVQARDANAQMSGYLDLRQGRKWKRRWFVAHNMILYRYKRHEDIAATATMPLLGYRLCKVEKVGMLDYLVKQVTVEDKCSHNCIKSKLQL
jgi:FYVE/RhoGEF/PH domain-containing protein 5/6